MSQSGGWHLFKGAAAAMSLALAGCSHAPLATSDATEAPASQVLVSTSPVPGATAAVTFKRARSLYGSACAVTFHADGKPLGSVHIGERFTAHLAAGSLILSAQLDGALCPRETREIRVELRPDQARAFFVDLPFMQSLVFQETAF